MSKNVTKIECYIEEYNNDVGILSARLRDKATNKKVVIVGDNADKNHFLRFLSQAKLRFSLMPTIYNRFGNDIVAVRGYVVSESVDEIVVCIDIETGGYLFE